MKKFINKAIAVLLSVITVISASVIPTTTVFAASYSINYSAYSAPSSSDYAYWNGSRMVKASGTTSSEIKWMQSALNYCIAKKGLKASKLDVDASFGPATSKTTKAFQKKYGLKQDSSFGPDTIAKMKTVLGIKGNTNSGTSSSSTYLTIYSGIYTVPATCYVSRNGGTMTLNIKSSSKWSVRTSGNWISVKISGSTLKVTFKRTFSSNGRSAFFTVKNNDGLSKRITLQQLPIPKESNNHKHTTKYIMLFSINETADMVFTSVKICTTCGYVFKETANSWSPPFDDSMI